MDSHISRRFYLRKIEREKRMTNNKQNPPTLAMRLNDADKKALRLVAAHMGTSQTEAVRRMTRERLATYSLAEKSKKNAKGTRA